ncbi:WD repeat-containing protein 55 isoform X2 [Malus domestica]|uniref:WD repeat-containing protein 55 isoform X2 n=1 Tax=Malus domestica TaxID=3750 RepID=UPI003975B2F9
MEINLGHLAFDIDFHPSQQLVTTGLINGDLHLYRYTSDSVPQRVLEVHAHSESCRAVRFINNGQAILTGSPDCSILATDVETGASIARLDEAHGSAVNKLINLTESTVASGDDEGCIKVWDTRQQSCCNTFKAHEEYISDMTFAADSMKLLGTSGDGTLSVCNLRRNKVQAQSEFSEEELLSVVIMKNGRKVVCSSHIGNLLLYSWGCFKDCSDRFVDLSPNSVDVLLKLDEDRLITGSETGLISYGIWMNYCKVLQIHQGLKQLQRTAIVTIWIWIRILRSLTKVQRRKMQAKIVFREVQMIFLLIYRWRVEYGFSTLVRHFSWTNKIPIVYVNFIMCGREGFFI